jgi:hypothetical protein
MNWKKRRIITVVYQAEDFLITEEANGEDKPFRLDSPDADAEWFSTLAEAKRVATLQNELALFKRDNEQLRAESAERQGRWPDADDASTIPGRWADDAPEATAARSARADESEPSDDGRGIPTAPDTDPAAVAHATGGIRETLHGMFG